MSTHDWYEARHAPRPERRRPRLADRRMFRVLVSLDDSQPQIWRRLDLRSDLTLSVVHQGIQAAFGWWDYHLYRFSLGGGVWDHTSQVFACTEDLQESDVDDGSILDSLVRLDETVQEPGDVLHYGYDYGDDWQLTIRLEDVLPYEPNAPSAVCVAGGRAAPPEDCGHLVTEEELATVLDDPAAFDLEEVNNALAQPYFVLMDRGVAAPLVELVNRLSQTDVGVDVTARALDLSLARPAPTDDEWSAALRAHRWFLDRAVGDGIPLTAAGYLTPVDVVAVAPLVPTAADWLGYGKNNRESGLVPLWHFRQSLQKLGLLRKTRGRLVLTKAGRDAQRDVGALRAHLVARLSRIDTDRWTAQVTLLTLLYAATSADTDFPLASVAAALREFGWRDANGPVQVNHVRRSAVLDVLRNVSDSPVGFDAGDRISAVAAALAAAALTTSR